MHHRSALKLVALLVLLVAASATNTAGADERYLLSDPVVHDNLAVYFVRGASSTGPVPLTLEEALSKGLWKGVPAARSRAEYWAAGVEAYFDAAGDGQAPNLADRPITTREALRAYDSGLYALVDETMAYKEHVDWRFRR